MKHVIFRGSPIAAFERVATEYASRIAVSSETWQPTYRELNEAANRLANHLIAAGLGLPTRSAVLMAHDAPMVAAIVGCVKAGQTVVALDPGEPLSRLKVLVEDSEPSVIVADADNFKLATSFAPPGCRILNFESVSATGLLGNPTIDIPPTHIAVLNYTSGSTGRPKGVIRTHEQLCRTASVHTDAMQSSENDRITLFASLSTGQGMSFLWWILLNGAMVCPFPVKTLGVTGMADWMRKRGITVYASSASIFRTFAQTLEDNVAFPDVRLIWLGSEPVSAKDFGYFCKHFPETSVLVHGFSSSETSIIAWSRWKQNDAIPDGVFPVGHFAKDLDVSLIGDDGNPVAAGEVGEIVVKSRYLVGYWQDPALTAERYSADLDETGTRLVRTGDLGRINERGLLELRGRKDDRVKVRGNRIELSEIDRALERLSGVDRAATIAAPREKYEPILVAYITKTPGDASLTASLLRQRARTILPIHMVPSKFVFLERMPYNAGNKVDREALRRRASLNTSVRGGERPRTETEILLADIWSETLDVRDISLNDDFFDLGGDSLKGAIIGAQVHALLGVELNLGTIADYPTVSALAKYIDESLVAGTGSGPPPIVPVSRSASMPLSSYQHYLWPYRANPVLTYLSKSRISGPLDVEIFQECMRYLTTRHEILRTTIGLVDGAPAQIIHQTAPLDFTFIDLTNHADPEGQTDAIFRDAGSRAFDVEALPLVRYVLTKVSDKHYRLARVVNAMMSDGFTSQLLDTEFALLYGAKLQGREPPLPTRAPLQYADYAVWEHQVGRFDDQFLEKSSAWWREMFSPTPPATRLPLRRLLPRAKLDRAEGLLSWTISEGIAKRLDQITRAAATTPFTIRLAAFVALVAEVTGNANVVFWTVFDNRSRIDAQTIAGPFANIVPLVFSFDENRTFLEWLRIVHARLFETLAHGDLPFENIKERLQKSGIESPQTDITFMLSRDNSNQRLGDISISNEAPSLGAMSWGCAFYVDANKPENCQVRFDANLYQRSRMKAFLDLYLKLLENVASEPELPLRKLLRKAGVRRLRWNYRKHATRAYEYILNLYAASPLLRSLWRSVKGLFVPSG